MGRFLLFGTILVIAGWIAFRLVQERSQISAGSRVVPQVAGAQSSPPSSSSKENEREMLDRDAPSVVSENPLSDVLCPASMLLVAGSYCAALSQSCLKEGKVGCEEFSRAECKGGEQRLQFCIDRYEYPNLPGALPATMIHFDEARRSCEAEGKRLCRENEWTVACEGNEYRPFSYGFRDQPNVCNIGQSVEPVEWQVFSDPERTAEEMSRIDARSASGSRPGCVSSTGAYDLLGNAAEWVSGEDPNGRAVLKGGDFHQEYATCRSNAKIAHRLLRLPYNGFRCCVDPLVKVEGQASGQGSK